MPAYLKPTLMASHLNRPGVVPRPIEVGVPAVVAQLNKYMDAPKALHPTLGVEDLKAPPERDAIEFYLKNHAVAVLHQRFGPEAELPSEVASVMNDYHAMLAVKSVRMFYYLLLICTRESRHEKSDYSSNLWVGLRGTYGEAMTSFHKTIKGSGSSGAVSKFRKHPPTVTLKDYTSFLTDVFFNGKYSGGYGGPAWGEVAKVIRDFVHGTLSAEMMMDTAFTLAHNNGPIFNKGMLYHGYTQEIYKILDVQRSGQIPQYVESTSSSIVDDRVKKTHASLKAIIGYEFGGYVDWFKVEALGAMKSYPAEKAQQVATHGKPTSPEEKQKKAPTAPTQATKPSDKVSYFSVFPGQNVSYVFGER